MTIGGWGTRGKSGTERLKAALFHSLHYDVVVKTTGCEAMFIHARRGRPAHEVFLYRPYDKATIWEQRDVLRTGAKLGGQVFLWECMALQPQFVQLLADEWMKDPVTTLTNAYPDHEDVMGPAGEDVARTIALFMPRGGTCITSEVQMLPLIKAEARRRGTHLKVLEPLSAELLPKDVLKRYPYDEHPFNVSLVLMLAEHLGIDRDRALFSMGDFVVPDLGVLKTYPTVTHRSRSLFFSNGMSANERAGFLSNWKRLGLDATDVDEQSELFTVAVVNNRADRVARSRVFAEIVTADVSVDVTVLIGTNLGGMKRFILEAADKWVAQIELPAEGNAEEALLRLEVVMRRVRVPQAQDAVALRVGKMLSSLGLGEEAVSALAAETQRVAETESEPEALPPELVQAVQGAKADAELKSDVLHHAAGVLGQRRALVRLRRVVGEAWRSGNRTEAVERVRKLCRSEIERRLYVVERADTTGDGVIDHIARQVFPGHRAWILGCQNIKGTGLDFVYRWVSIGATFAQLERLKERPESASEVIPWLLSYTDYGLLDARECRRVVEEWLAKSEPGALRSLGEATLERLKGIEATREAKLGLVAKPSALERLLNTVEPLVDHWDSVRRRRLATQILEDVYAQRVGQGRAAILFRDLTARGKGGWLVKDLAKWRAKHARSKDEG